MTKYLVAALAIVHGTASFAGASTLQELFTKQVSKYTSSDTTIKAVCACQDGSDEVGVLLAQVVVVDQEGDKRVKMYCEVPTFTAAGGGEGTVPCSPYVVLGK